MTLPISNAAGTVKLIEQAQRVARAPVAEVVIGSYTIDPRDGNGGKVYESRAGIVLNALGLPNPSAMYACEHRDEFLALGKPVVVSIAGFQVQEFAVLTSMFDWAQAIEVNLGCPNVWDDGEQKRIGSFDPAYVRAVLREVEGFAKVRVKLSPYSDPVLLAEVAGVVDDFEVEAVVASNTFPNGWLPDALSVSYGGVSGSVMKAIVLGQVRQFVALGHRVIAAGGVRAGADLADYEAAGAIGVQVASRYLDGGEDPGVFADLLADATPLPSSAAPEPRVAGSPSASDRGAVGGIDCCTSPADPERPQDAPRSDLP
jgi:dihydroorotate dehydrogenase